MGESEPGRAEIEACNKSNNTKKKREQVVMLNDRYKKRPHKEERVLYGNSELHSKLL